MKGPGLRNDLEIRRTFLCPRCGRSVLKLGDVVSLSCACEDPPVWMQIQPDPARRIFKFDKIEIPLSEADLVIRDRPRRMPPAPPEGVEIPNDRRNARPKRPKPERRSFESFQEDLAAKVQAESGADAEVSETLIIESKSIEVTETPAATDQTRQPEPSAPADDAFGEGL